jgi:predicted hydrocarbon binding protein
MASFMEASLRHPVLFRRLFRLLTLLPLPVVPRSVLGATAFEVHHVDLAKGRIGIGGVDEVLTGSKLIQLMHTVTASRVGEDESARILYELGEGTCRWEVGEAVRHGKWAPPGLVDLIFSGHILEDIQKDEGMARLFGATMQMMTRIIANEGGWGNLDFDFRSRPIRVWLDNSQEAAWLSPSSAPVCHYFAGIVAGYGSSIAGRQLVAREVRCAACGDDRCEFELTEAGPQG